MVDVAIIGAGPAGLSAAVYASRAGLSTVVFEGLSIGGKLSYIASLENYPGLSSGVSGADFALALQKQAEHFGAKIIYEQVISVSAKDYNQTDLGAVPKFTVVTNSQSYEARAVIVATGSQPQKLKATLGKDLEGKGVSYCATCDGNFFKGKIVAVVGGGDAACADALYLARIASQVHLIHRKDHLSANRWYQERVLNNDAITIHWNTEVTDVVANPTVSAVQLKNTQTHESTQLSCSGLFVATGSVPATDWLGGLVERDSRGRIVTNAVCETACKGLFAVGDVRQTPLRQVVTAAADGALAAEEVAKQVPL